MDGKFGIFNPLQQWKKGDLPANALVYVVLNTWSSIGENLVSISPSLASDGEVDEVIDHLIKDLEKVRREAKQVLKRQNKKIRESLTAQS